MYTYPQALDAMQKIAQDLLGPRYAVTVIPDATTGTASVTWDDFYNPVKVTIRMPVLPAKHRMTQAEFDDYAGLVLHEVGHPKYTDKATWEAAVRQGRATLLKQYSSPKKTGVPCAFPPRRAARSIAAFVRPASRALTAT